MVLDRMLDGTVYGGDDLGIVTMATVVIMLTTFTRVEDEKSEYALVLSLWIFTHHGICSVCYTYSIYIVYIVYIFCLLYIIFIYIHVKSFLVQPSNPFMSSDPGCFHLLWCLTEVSFSAQIFVFFVGRRAKIVENYAPEDSHGTWKYLVWKMIFLFWGVYSQVPCWSFGV